MQYDKGGLTFYELARRFPDQEFLGVHGGYGDQFVPDDLPPNVTIWEHTNNILDVYRQSKIMLVPSRYESYGRVPIEAACSSIPSLVTETEGTREALGYAATFCERHNDFDEWEDKLGWLLKSYDSAAEIAHERALWNWNRTLTEWRGVQELVNKMGG
jgi:glycosyltransferase involved in cell wall biosynthesis